MKTIDLQGITNMELVRGGTDEWYWSTDYIHGDLYEAEELFRMGHPVQSNRLYLIHYPDGTVYEPVPAVAGQYLGYPVYDIVGQHFTTPAVGESVSLVHPLTGQAYTLTVHEVEQQELPERAFHDPNMEYPNHYVAMSYSLEPDISGRGFMIQDCAEGDRPKQKKRDPNEFAPVAFSSAAVIGVIGGADGPTSVIMGQSIPKLHAACSSLHFEPITDEVEWRVIFSEKLMDDVDVILI